MSNVAITQSISKERQALFAEHERLCKADIHDRVANERRQEIWQRLVKAPTVVVTTGKFNAETDTLEIHHEWRE